MRYNKYPSYKDSGVDWLGEIPENWELIQSRRLFQERKGRAKKGDVQLTSSQKYGVIPQKEFMELEGRKVTLVLTGNEILKHIESNDFVISMRSFQGGLEYSKYSGSVSSAYVGIIPIKHVNSRFFTYLFKSKPYIQALQSTSNLVRDGQALRFDNFSLVDLMVIPNKEQQTIANYLDIATAKIDTLIEKQTKLIGLLKEKRQAVISTAVTRGLDSTVAMKDSGVEWLGEIPEGWEVKKLKYNLSLQTDKVTITNQEVIALENIASWSGKYIPTDSEYQGDDVEFKKNDVLFGKLRPYLAKVYQCKNTGVAFGDILVYRPTKQTESKFAFYTMISEAFIDIVDGSTYGSKMPRASVDFVSNMPIAVAPKQEQVQIAEYLDNNIMKIDNLITKSTKAIDLLKEKRTALISAVVTGKIDVREIA